SWKRLFDEYLRERSGRTSETFRPFGENDYLQHVDGKPRYDGVRDFLASRGITLPDGEPTDPPGRETVCGLGNRKDGYFLARLREGGADPYPSTVELVRRLSALGVGTAVISSSRNMTEVLAAAGVADLFDVRVDGIVSDDLGLTGKPDPAIFLEAARRLGVDPSEAAVVEDAVSGVEAGRRGRFALVVGVDRAGHAAELSEAGADVVVADLADLDVETRRETVLDLPSALARWDEIAERLKERTPAVFLDYDGTLTPIVERPEDAVLSPETRDAVRNLAERCTVAVVSGRDLADVRTMVGVDGIWYAGSHGFDIAGPGERRHQHGTEFLPDLDAADKDLVDLLAPVPGARVERKTFAIAVHFRQASEDRIPEIEAAVERVAAAHGRLRRTGGKKVFELRPDIPWDKGKALMFLLGVLAPDGPAVVPIYVGDDETDEDAFRAVDDTGIGVVVRGEGDDRPTRARYALDDAAEARDLLDGLRRLLEGRTA
ncbi:MAG TPA: trehalose-phosphatase, partial [Actinomycetota bacterium]